MKCVSDLRLFGRPLTVLLRRTMAEASKLISVVQMRSTNDVKRNFQISERVIARSSRLGAKVVFLPECCDFIGTSIEESISLSLDSNELNAAQLGKSFDKDSILGQFCAVAQRNKVWLNLGGIHVRAPTENSPADSKPLTKLWNSNLLIDSEGSIVSRYDKTHLFDVSLPERGLNLQESSYTFPGQQLVDPVNSPCGRLGLLTCYDLRFAEVSQVLRRRGAQLLTYPSAFSQPTGVDHWQPLLQARAIETQCYVVAAAQTGRHSAKRASHGHALVVDPWGRSSPDMGSDADGQLVLAEINLGLVDVVRQQIPVEQHRRHDLYYEKVATGPKLGDGRSFAFSQAVSIKSKFVFAETTLSYACVNRKPVLPGHVLVIPKRVVQRVQGLTVAEVGDLFLLVQQVQNCIEQNFNASSSTISIQDGVDAGQSVRHVHVHVLPRHAGDFEDSDEIYEQLQHHDKDPAAKFRSEDEMRLEASQLASYFA